MDIQNILTELETRRNSEPGLTETEKNLSLVLGAGDEFLQTLPDEQKTLIISINSDPPGQLNALPNNNEFRKLWYYYLTFTNNKNKRTTQFANTLVGLETKIKSAETALNNIEKNSW